LKATERNDDKEPAGNKMRKIMGQKAIKALINKEKNPENIELFSPLVCYDGKQKINGCEDTTLIDMCKLFSYHLQLLTSSL